MNSLAVVLPVLAAGKEEAIVTVIVFIITIIGWISKLASSRVQKGPPVINRPRPPVRPRDDRLQREISIFVEDNAGRRSQGAGSRPQPQNSGQGKRRPAAGTPASKKKARPGEEMASRHAPVTESLGTNVKQHLSQNMTDRVTQEVQQRMSPRVEQQVAADLGTTVTGGATPAAARPRAERFAELLRNPAGVQQAIVLNLILSPPPGRSGAHRR